MKYKVILTSREIEIIGKDFDFDKFYHNLYDNETRLHLTREAWSGNIPLYLHQVGGFDKDYLIEKARGIITDEPVFSIFDKDGLTFEQMINAIHDRRKKIITIIPGDANPYA